MVAHLDLRGCITSVSLDFTEVSGFSEEALLGKPYQSLRHPEMPSTYFADLWKALQAGHPWSEVAKCRAKDGAAYWVEDTVSPVREGSRITGYLSVCRAPSAQQVAEAKAEHARLQAGRSAQPWLAGALARINAVSIRSALPGGLAVILLLFSSALGIALLNLGQAAAQLEHLDAETLVIKQSYDGMLGEGLQMIAAMRHLLMYPDDQQARNNLRNSHTLFSDAVITAQRLSADEADTLATLRRIAEGRDRHHQIEQQVLTYLAANDLDGARELYTKEGNPVWRQYKIPIQELRNRADQLSRTERASFVSAARQAQNQAVIFGVLAVLVAVVLGLWLVRKINSPLRLALHHLEAIAEGDYSQLIHVPNRDEFGEILQALKIVQGRTDANRQSNQRMLRENLAIRTGLDHVSAPMTLSDANNRLVYMNLSARTLWSKIATAIASRHPGLTVERMFGTSLADYFEDETVKADFRANLGKPHSFEMELGGHHLQCMATPIYDPHGNEYLGRVSQWDDRSVEVLAEREIADLIEAATRGEFSQRLRLDNKNGFARQIAEGLNQLLDIISKGLGDVATVLEAIAEGNLAHTIDADYQGTFGQLKDDTNTTVMRLREVVGQIMDASAAINSAAGEISTGNSDLSSRTEQQAASLEETSSSMDELNATVGQNANDAEQANELTQKVNQVAVEGGARVRQVVETMSSIAASSRQIADIIGVIDGIAFQTNILALNAAVEAARAGEQGRGFAVVAAEVRNLAQRSASAAKEIKELITASVARIDQGAHLVNGAGDTMEEIVTRFERVATLIDGITRASREQSSGIEQVARAVTQMDEMTQQNAALVEQAAAAAESLTEQTQTLTKTVGIFQLDTGALRALPAR